MSSWTDEQKREAQEQEILPPIDINTLEGEQRAVLEEYVNAYKKILEGNASPQLLLNVDGTAGCGKTYLIRAICQELRKMAIDHDQPDPILVLAPSGVATLNIHGRTIHSALSLPLHGFSLLAGTTGIHFIIIDEKSMLSQRTLAMINSRCRQIFRKGQHRLWQSQYCSGRRFCTATPCRRYSSLLSSIICSHRKWKFRS